MLTRCLFCRLEYRPNPVLEHFSEAREVAYDPERGRLWAICRGCGRWTLVPFESRWEALEELERSVDSFRPLAKTGNIALFRAHQLHVVRIGHAPIREEAWWRYGRRLVKRRFLNVGFAAGVTTAVFALPLMAFGGAVLPVIGEAGLVAVATAPEAFRLVRFGWKGWKSPITCLRCDHQYESLSYRVMGRLRVVKGKRAGELGVRLACTECYKWGLQLNGAEAEMFARRYLAWRNMFGARRHRIDAAADHLESAGTSGGLISRYTRERARLSKVSRAEILAFEMALSDSTERALLDLKLNELEARWKEAEEIAAIADGELTPIPKP